MDLSNVIEVYEKCKNMEYELSEQDTKHAFIIPVLRLLGYDIENIFNIKSEYKTHKSEAVDYAILKDLNPYIFIEAKRIDEPLLKHISQLTKYYNMTLSVKYGILTNGIDYWCFTDSKNVNIMDEVPFLKINLLSSSIKEIETFFKLFNSSNLNDIEKNIDSHLDVLALDNIFNKHILEVSDEFIDFIETITGRKADKKYVSNYINMNGFTPENNKEHRIEIILEDSKLQGIKINNKNIKCNKWKVCYIEFIKWVVKRFDVKLNEFVSKSYYFESYEEMPDYLLDGNGYYQLDDGTYVSSHISSSQVQTITEKICDYYNINYKLTNIETTKDCD